MSSPKPSYRNLERVKAWGEANSNLAHVFRPQTLAEIREVFQVAREKGYSIGLRGTGCSYGDASLNRENIVLDLTQMNRILKWDAETGVVTAEAGVTIKQLWESTLEDGFWPPVVSGTMYPTLGGVASMNIHGKNNFKVGPIGDQILDFDILLPTGELKHCSRNENAELFHAAIGGFGMLGVFTSITLQMKKVYSGYLAIEPIYARNLAEMFVLFEERLPEADYLVGWIDCLKRGKKLGRGIIHQANYLEKGADPNPQESLRVANQVLPDRILGVFPKSLTYLLMRPWVNNCGMRLINAAKYWSTRLSLRGHVHLQSHAGFAFLLDYVPNWKWAYKPGGLIQYQLFVPKEKAQEIFAEVIAVSQRAGLPPYLGVMKRHRTDPFLMTHTLDGYSFALDFKVTQENRERLWQLAHQLDEIVLAAGGKFYFAKDSTLEKKSIERFLAKDRLEKFTRLKRQCDPENLLQTDLSRRLFGF